MITSFQISRLMASSMSFTNRLTQMYSKTTIYMTGTRTLRTKPKTVLNWHGPKQKVLYTCRSRHKDQLQYAFPSRQYSQFSSGCDLLLRRPALHSMPSVFLQWKQILPRLASFHLHTTQTRGYSTEGTIKAKVRGIQKDVSPLTTKRVLRRKKTKDSTTADKIVFDVVAFAVAEEIDLEGLQADLHRQGLYSLSILPRDVVEVMHVQALYKVDDEMREMFFFREGSVIFWNMPEVERNSVLTSMRRHQTDSYDHLLINENFEKVDFTFIDTSSKLDGDEIQLRRLLSKEEFESQQLEKYTFSNALALSVKLSIWEASLERYVDSIEWILQDLKEGKKISMSRAEVLRKTGELFTLRHLINLSSDLLDTPDFYWDREALELLYTNTCTHLSISRRTKVMNEKLTHCCELAELVREHLNDKHHTRLEWMIIILIMIEVLFEIVHIIERHG